MSIHINANKGDVAETVLLPGDPLRAKHIAENFLEHAECYNTVRNMFGFTGSFKGKKVSIQGTGMGQPSASIYINELISSFGVKRLIRIGSCGSISKYLPIRKVIVAMSASTDSSMNRNRFRGYDYAATASSDLLFAAYEYAKSKSLDVSYGGVVSADAFYGDDLDEWKMWAQYGMQAIEMETSQLYTLAAKHDVKALSILTVSDSLVTQEETTSEEREKTFNEMIDIALNIV